MAPRHKTKVRQSENVHTQYLFIPSVLVRDSQYLFKKDQEVEIVVDPKEKKIIVKNV